MHPNRSMPSSVYDQVLYEALFHINQMPTDHLRKLNDIPSELSTFIQQLPTVQSMESKRRQLIERNRRLAMNNLKKEPELISVRQKLANTMAELGPLREKYLQSRLEKHAESPSADFILVQLQSAAHESERSNDELTETFFRASHNDHDVEIFVQNFLHDRQKTIELRIFAEKFFDLYQIEKQRN